MNTYLIDYGRLSFLGERVKANLASKAEKDEYMLMLRHSGNITEQQYNDYLANRNSEELLNAALSVGAIVLIGYVLKELFTSK